MTDVFVPGLVAVIVFYVAILAIGIWAAWKKRKQPGEDDHWNEFSMVGRRDIGVFVGTFTMTASLVGGVYINGIAEFTYTPGFGLVWLQGWFGFVFVLVIGGIFYAKKMREKGYATMLDPLQRKLGNKMGALLYIPAFMGDLFWTASVLIALGGTLSVVIGLDLVIAIIISAFIAVLYTLLGGLYSVAYTDVVQISFIFVGLWIATGFAFANPAVTDIRTTGPGGWYGSFTEDTIGSWIDTLLLFLCGSIPWQVYFQRVLSAESPRKAQIVSCFSAVVAFILGIPPMLIGAIAASTDWNTTAYEGDPLENGQGSIILPIVLRYLTPPAVAVVGLAAVAAAVMSSIDSSVLSASSMFTRNVYKLVLRPKASNREITWVMRIMIILIGVIAAVIACLVQSVYVLWYLSIDFVYTILFPQLTCVLYLDINIYGSLPAYFLAAILRLGGSDFYFDYPPFIYYPGALNFPIKTFSMLISAITLIVVSYLARFLFVRGYIPEKYDFLKANLAHGGRSIELQEDTDSHSDEKKGEVNPGFNDMAEGTQITMEITQRRENFQDPFVRDESQSTSKS